MNVNMNLKSIIFNNNLNIEKSIVKNNNVNFNNNKHEIKK